MKGEGGSFELAGQRFEIREWEADTGATLRVATTTGLVVEHWRHGDGGSSVFLKGSARDLELLRRLEPDAVKCCEIEGEDWADCMRKYHEHMGWGPYSDGKADDRQQDKDR